MVLSAFLSPQIWRLVFPRLALQTILPDVVDLCTSDVMQANESLSPAANRLTAD